MGKFTQGEMIAQIQTFQRFMDDNGYATSVVAVTKDHDFEGDDDNTQQAASCHLDGVRPVIALNLAQGLDSIISELKRDIIKRHIEKHGVGDLLEGAPKELLGKLKDALDSFQQAH